MDWLDRMNNTINYIEDNLMAKIDYEKAAKIAYCSVYHFQRMFSFITNVTLSEYVRRRRMTLAAFELQNTSIKVIDLALKYGYESPEAFTRAFQNLHGVTPTSARNMGVNFKAYPRLSFQISIKGDLEMNYKIEKKDSFTVYGVEKIFDTQNDANLKDIPDFWNEKLTCGEYDALAKSAGENPNHKNGLFPVNAICGYKNTGGTTFPYMLCALENPDCNMEGYTIVQVPASTWAIFTSEEYDLKDISKSMQDLSRRVYSEWLPTSNYEVIDGYDLEMYYSKENGKEYCEVWIRVSPKK